jgi:hypothetical protein
VPHKFKRAFTPTLASLRKEKLAGNNVYKNRAIIAKPKVLCLFIALLFLYKTISETKKFKKTPTLKNS